MRSWCSWSALLDEDEAGDDVTADGDASSDFEGMDAEEAEEPRAYNLRHKQMLAIQEPSRDAKDLGEEGLLNSTIQETVISTPDDMPGASITTAAKPTASADAGDALKDTAPEVMASGADNAATQ